MFVMKNACQSCGMPLSKDPQGGGTEADKSISTTYCSYCYQNGTFTHPSITLDEMKTLVKTAMREKGFPRLVCWFFAKATPKLKRWQKK
jgi:hypothetical protein